MYTDSLNFDSSARSDVILYHGHIPLSSDTVVVTGLLLVLFASFLDICHIHCFTTLAEDGYLLYPCCVLIPLIAGNENAKGIELLELSKPAKQGRAAIKNSLSYNAW